MRNGPLNTGAGFPVYVGQADNRPRPQPGDIDLGGGFWLPPDNPNYGLQYIIDKHGTNAKPDTNKPKTGIFTITNPDELKAIIAETVHDEPGYVDNRNPKDPRTIYYSIVTNRSEVCPSCSSQPVGYVYFNKGLSRVPAYYVWVIVNAFGVVTDAYPSEIPYGK